MASKDLLLKPPTPRERAHRRHAIAASLGLHSLLLAAAIGVAICYHEETKPNGSPPGLPTITLSTLVITPPPAAPPLPPAPEKPIPPTPTPPTPSTPEPSHVASTPPPAPVIQPTPPEEAVPVLPPAPPKPQPTHTIAQKTPAPSHPPAPHPVASNSNVPAKPQTQETASSSYAPGRNDLPFPPYPPEAQSAGKAGTVVVDVQFNQQGRVTSAEVEQSSGNSILDSSTRTFIRTHWHSQTYAGQTISVPVKYRLENL